MNRLDEGMQHFIISFNAKAKIGANSNNQLHYFNRDTQIFPLLRKVAMLLEGFTHIKRSSVHGISTEITYLNKNSLNQDGCE